MRLPSLGGMWPGRVATSSPDPEQPQMVEATRSHDDLHPRELVQTHRSTVLSLDREDSRSPLAARPSQADGSAARDDVESPKTLRSRLAMTSLTSSRLHLPRLSRTGITGSNATRSLSVSASAGQRLSLDEPPPRFPFASSEQTMSRVITEPQLAAAAPEPQAGSRMSSFSEAMLREIPRDIRYEETHVRGAILGETDEAAGTREETPRGVMGRLPNVRSRRARTQIIQCLVSGLFLIALLATCMHP